MSVETNIGIYNGTKAALLHLTRELAAELSPGVRVNAIAPGLVKTDMARALWEPNEQAIANHIPLKRLGEPADIADAAVFLCSDHARWITGTTMVIDGGMLLHVSFFPVGTLNLGLVTLGSLLFLLVGYWLSLVEIHSTDDSKRKV